MAGKSGGAMDTVKVGMRMFEVGMRFINNLDKYSKNAEKIRKFFGRKEKQEIDVGMYVEKEKPAPKKFVKSNPLMDRMVSDKEFSEFLNLIFDKKNVFGNLPDSWVIQQSLLDKYEELKEFETMGDLRNEVKSLLKK